MSSLFEAVHTFTQHLPDLIGKELARTVALGDDEVCLPRSIEVLLVPSES
jgi:hypothetical protein